MNPAAQSVLADVRRRYTSFLLVQRTIVGAKHQKPLAGISCQLCESRLRGASCSPRLERLTGAADCGGDDGAGVGAELDV
jgi:hypothetical protein